MQFRILSLIFLFASLNACMVGPDFHKPKAPRTHKYLPQPSFHKTISTPSLGKAGKVQHIDYGKQLPRDWWKLFHSHEINKLVQLGLKHSPNLIAAKETLREANEIYKAQIGLGLLPSIDAQFTGVRQRVSSASFGAQNPTSGIFNLFNASANISYTLDLFGGIRRQIEGYGAQVDFQAYELQAAYLILTANIVTTSITIASLEEQIKATKELIVLQRNAMNILSKQFHLGGIARSSVLSQESQLAQTIATLPPLKQSLAQAYHALSVLIGEFPSKNELPKIDLNSLHLPTHIPVVIPSLLVRQRPDILASEALLHVASAQIGVATANLLPQVTLTGNYGWQNTLLSDLFNSNSKIWNLTGSILQPIFRGGALLAERRAAIAAYNAALAQYQQTVLQAFQNVADSLRALQHDAEELKAQRESEIASKQFLQLIQQQFYLGGVPYLTLLIAELQYQQAVLGRIRAQGSRYADTAALFQALGGGWWCPFDVLCEGMQCKRFSKKGKA